MDTSEKPIMVVGFDEGQNSCYALEWTLDRFFLPYAPNFPFNLILVHAMRPSSSLNLISPTEAEVLRSIERDLRRIGEQIVGKAKKICATKKMKEFSMDVIEGNPRNILCEAVEKNRASVLVVGAHDYGPIKRVVLESVSDYCFHHAQCSVIIVKQPKINPKGFILHT
ncbi:uncharacterized protein LOC115716476 [Cannabis sativa]|nr:uncharacterized protein LOC115716476 [Cannabis sativa]KAF4364469.1 hypothetical protein F8388_007046 [Cannabis sativa]